MAIFDLVNMRNIEKILIFDNPRMLNPSATNMVFDRENNKILFEITYNLLGANLVTDRWRTHYISFNTKIREIEEITQYCYYDTLYALGISSNPFSHISQGVTRTLIFRNNGVFVNDGRNNIRISRTISSLLGNRPLWLGNGEYVIIGSYIFSTSGRLYETRIADGKILAVF